MDRRVNHEWLPGETLIEHNRRLAAETEAYKTTVHYWLFDIDHKLRTLSRDETGRKITKEEGTR